VPACEEKDRLTRAYSSAASDYSRAVELLQKRSGVMSKQDYENIYNFVERARKQVEHARAALEKHTAEHSC
jgi:multidrug resistance efflux pump